MHGYDVALKLLLQSPNTSILSQVTGVKVEHWLTAELPQVQTSRADLLGETSDGSLVHVELQTTNDPEMALRMIEYGLRVFRKLKQYPKQIVVYVGEAPMRMPSRLSEPKSASPVVEFHYTLIDIRELDGSALMASPHIADNLLAVLTPLQNRMATIREILARPNCQIAGARTAGRVGPIFVNLRTEATCAGRKGGSGEDAYFERYPRP